MTDIITRFKEIVGGNQKEFAKKHNIFESDLSSILRNKIGISRNFTNQACEFWIQLRLLDLWQGQHVFRRQRSC